MARAVALVGLNSQWYALPFDRGGPCNIAAQSSRGAVYVDFRATMMTIVGGRFLLRRRCRRWTVVPGIARCLHTPHHEPPVVKEFVQIREDVHGRTRFYRPSADKTSIDWTWDTETQDIGRAGVAWRLLPAPLREWVRTLLLPVGYPSSVHSSYARVHVLQALETYIWSTVSRSRSPAIARD